MMLIDIEPILDAAKLAGKEYVSIDFLKGFEQVDAVPVVRGGGKPIMTKLLVYIDIPELPPFEMQTDRLRTHITDIAQYGYMDPKSRTWYPAHRITRIEWVD